MNTSRTLRPSLMLAYLILNCHAAVAKDFSLNMPGGTSYNWNPGANAAPWTPAASPGEPGASDTVALQNGSGAANLFLNTDQTVQRLSREGGGSLIRVQNGFLSNGATQVDNTLTVTEIAIDQGSLQFQNRTTSTNLKVHTTNLSVGNTTGSTSAALNLGAASLSLNEFTVSGTTTVKLASSIAVVDPNAQTSIDFGFLDFSGATTATVSLGSTVGNAQSYTVKAKGLSSVVNSSAKITVSAGTTQATVNLTGTLADDVKNYSGLIENGTGTVAIDKTGSNTQILSRSAGNTYSGGTSVSSGILAVENTTGSGVGSGTLFITGTGVLAGGGRVELGPNETFTVNDGGGIAPGAASDSGFASLTLSGASNGSAPILEMEEAAYFTFALGSGNQSDSIRLTSYAGFGDLLLSNNKINVINAQAGTFTLFYFSNGTDEAVSSGLASGLQLGTGFAGHEGVFSYNNDPLNADYGTISLIVTAVPEPSSLLLLGCAIAVGVSFRLWPNRKKDEASA